MTSIPRDPAPDSTLALLSEGYTFIENRAQRFGSDLFETRLMLQRAVCMTGEDAARVFYSPGRMTRRAAMPLPAVLLLQDLGSVQLLDGDHHGHRKSMFLSLLMAPDRLSSLANHVDSYWRDRLTNWATVDQFVLEEKVREVLCRAVCDWAGIPLAEQEVGERTRELGAMIDGAGSFGPALLRGIALRSRNERWARNTIERVRSGTASVPEDSPIQVIAWHRAPDGNLLKSSTAAVELINILRPTVAVARFITFAALALHDYPEWRTTFESGDFSDLEPFVHEVRRFYPFFPFIAGRVLQPFDWKDHHFSRGAWAMLDLYGTNHDARIWPEPEAFRPQRFHDWAGDAHRLIPQGGGDYHDGHRCPGEEPTIQIMKQAVRLLTTAMRYDVPDQNLDIDLSNMPAVPASRFMVRDVQPAA